MFLGLHTVFIFAVLFGPLIASFSLSGLGIRAQKLKMLNLPTGCKAVSVLSSNTIVAPAMDPALTRTSLANIVTRSETVKIFAGALLASFVSFLTPILWQSRFATKLFMQLKPVAVPRILTDPSTPEVLNWAAAEALNKLLHKNIGGIVVVYAPTGAGKTTFLTSIANDRNKQGLATYLLNCIQNREYLYETLGVPRLSYDLSEVLQRGTLLIFDQVDSITLNEDAKNMFKQLALDSRRSRHYEVVVCVSDLVVANRILALNDHEKIKSAGPCTLFKWDTTMVKEYIERSTTLNKLSPLSKEVLVGLGVRAGTPGFLFEAATDANLDVSDPYYKQRAETIADKWTKDVDL